MLVIENVLTHAAEVMGQDPWNLRARNLYGSAAFRNTTPFGQAITTSENKFPKLVEAVIDSGAYAKDASKWTRLIRRRVSSNAASV